MDSDTPVPASKIRYFAHFVIRTSNYEAMVQWYQQFLVAEKVFSNARATFLTFDHEHHRVAIVNRPGLEPMTASHAGIDHVAYSLATYADLADSYIRLNGLGIAPFWAINHGPTTSLYYRDPDGNQIELQVDNGTKPGESRAYFDTPEFSANPLGVEFDADEFAARWSSRA
jgi:catechol-2,3-dioxygenase